ncbi:small ribosomal subunit protein uS15m-like [Watersipora subatra]|uniref:small ribosomal subunit protein uS15m-like n=1 Tax=Watersipora subatra TaxID=2589382 RepID=UPI00355BE324
MSGLPTLCRFLRTSTSVVINNTLLKASKSFEGLPCVQRCYYRTKWQKLRTHSGPTVPKFDYSGDNSLELPVQFAKDDHIFSSVGINSTELSEEEKELFTIHSADGDEKMKLLLAKVKDKFARDVTDEASQELQIAMITIHIRKQISHMQRFPKDKHTKRKLVEGIQLRTKMLKYLFRFDINRFNWVVKELDLTYIPTSPYFLKKSIRTQLRSKAIKEMYAMKSAKLAALEESLAAEREEYYAKKSQVMDAVRSEKDTLEKEKEELSHSCIQTGYPGNNGEVAYQLAHIQPINKERWWRGHPTVIEKFYGGKKPGFKGRVRKSQTL